MSKFYEAANITCNWNGINLSTGWAEDTFLTITPNSPQMTHTVGAAGSYVFSKSSDKGATITMTFQDTADAVTLIAAVNGAQGIIGAKPKIGVFTVTDLVGGTVNFITDNAVLTEMPEHSFGKEAGERTFTWVCETFIMTESTETATSYLSSYTKI